MSRRLAGVLRNVADRIDPPPPPHAFYVRPGTDLEELAAAIERIQRRRLIPF
ncbi:hypothetical protein ACW2Q0_00590 [Nocardia sp. R16R-3T]